MPLRCSQCFQLKGSKLCWSAYLIPSGSTLSSPPSCSLLQRLTYPPASGFVWPIGSKGGRWEEGWQVTPALAPWFCLLSPYQQPLCHSPSSTRAPSSPTPRPWVVLVLHFSEWSSNCPICYTNSSLPWPSGMLTNNKTYAAQRDNKFFFPFLKSYHHICSFLWRGKGGLMNRDMIKQI